MDATTLNTILSVDVCKVHQPTGDCVSELFNKDKGPPYRFCCSGEWELRERAFSRCVCWQRKGCVFKRGIPPLKRASILMVLVCWPRWRIKQVIDTPRFKKKCQSRRSQFQQRPLPAHCLHYQGRGWFCSKVVLSKGFCEGFITILGLGGHRVLLEKTSPTQSPPPRETACRRK